MSSQALIVSGRRVLTPRGIREASILVREGRIIEVSERRDASGAAVEEAGDLLVMPGLVDTHVHVNEPGRTDWEGFETATAAAAAGGVTLIVDMPLNSDPVTTTRDSLRAKLAAARNQLHVDCGFYGGLVPGSVDALPDLISAGVLGVKAFLIDSGIGEFPPVGEPELQAAMPLLARTGLPLLVHAELASPHDQLPAAPEPTSYPDYLASRPDAWEQRAVELLIRLCRRHRCPTHIVHVSSALTLPGLEKARADGLPLTVETCPHYLVFCAEQIPDRDTRFKCAPPIRSRENREQLWEALKRGIIDLVVTDHSPCPPQLKEMDSGDFVRAWGGIGSLQLRLPVLWTEARRRGFSLQDLSHWTAGAPARLVGLSERKGVIAPGRDADLVIWDPEASFTVEKSMLYHRHRFTPYEGMQLSGRVERTFVRGRKVFERNRCLKGGGAVVLHGAAG